MNYSYELECIAIQNEVCKTHSISVNSSYLIHHVPFSHYFVLLFRTTLYYFFALLCTTFSHYFVLLFRTTLYYFFALLCTTFSHYFVLLFRTTLYYFFALLCTTFSHYFVLLFRTTLYYFFALLCATFSHYFVLLFSSESPQKQPPEVFCKKGVLRNVSKLQENTCARFSFLIKLQALGLTY